MVTALSLQLYDSDKFPDTTSAPYMCMNITLVVLPDLR